MSKIRISWAGINVHGDICVYVRPLATDFKDTLNKHFYIGEGTIENMNFKPLKVVSQYSFDSWCEMLDAKIDAGYTHITDDSVLDKIYEIACRELLMDIIRD